MAMETGKAYLPLNLMERFAIWHTIRSRSDEDSAWRLDIVTVGPPIKGASDFRHPIFTDAVVMLGGIASVYALLAYLGLTAERFPNWDLPLILSITC
jgi:hypothetical protein